MCAGNQSGDQCARTCASSDECSSGESCERVAFHDGGEASACVASESLCEEALGLDPGGYAATSVLGNVGADGGVVTALRFAIVGDVRPATVDDTAGYPSMVVRQIWNHVAAARPAIPFAVTTGDYQYSRPDGVEANAQLDLYVAARAAFAGPVFATMGNHECTADTASNCGRGTRDGFTNNYRSFLDKLLAPLGKTSPNYSIAVNAADSTWSAKFIFVAGNAWVAADETWLETELSKRTTYTFIVRHEPRSATTAPGVLPSEALMKKYPYTLAIVGHTHAYRRSGDREVIIGNGGAPLSSAVGFGYGLVDQRSDGTLQVDMIAADTCRADPSFRFVLTAAGTIVSP